MVIDGSWDSYIKSLSKKFRRDINHKTNKMNKLGKWALKVDHRCSNGEFLDLMKKIESGSRNGSEKEFAQVKKNEAFLKKLCSSSGNRGWFDFSTLVFNDEPIAYLLGFRYSDRYYAYNMAYKQEFFQASPGKVLMHEKIRWCFGHLGRVKEFDFLRGAFYIKFLWASAARQHQRVVGFKSSLYSETLRRIVFKVRPAINVVRPVLGHAESWRT